jgi:hypothetical protein
VVRTGYGSKISGQRSRLRKLVSGQREVQRPAFEPDPVEQRDCQPDLVWR